MSVPEVETGGPRLRGFRPDELKDARHYGAGLMY
jgi:hypothetical protein